MKQHLYLSVTLALCSAGAWAQAEADSVAGIPLYPGASRSGVDSSQKMLKDSGYPTAVCRRTPDSVAKVVAFYRAQKQMQMLGEASKDNASFAGPAGASMSINSPWTDTQTLVSSKDTMICIVARK
jgi:hypothetical protein